MYRMFLVTYQYAYPHRGITYRISVLVHLQLYSYIIRGASLQWGCGYNEYGQHKAERHGWGLN
jgi:hypothetical protein